VRIWRILAKGLLLALAIALIPISAVSAPKVTPGSKCKVQKQKIEYLDKTYICIKIGKKLVWNKGTAVNKPTPSPTPTATPAASPTPVSTPKPTPTFSPWTIELNQEILVSQANKEFKKWTLIERGTEIVPTFSVDPKLDGVDISWIKKSLNHAVKAFGSDSPATYTVIVGKDCQWIRSVGSAPCIEASRNQYFSDSTSKGFFVLQSESDRAKLRPSDLQTSAHEYFHAIQAKLSGRSDWPSIVPSWFIEGGANFVGISFSDLSGVSTYLEGRNEAVLGRDYQSKKYLPLEQYTYLNFKPPANYENPYGIGCVATEYIVASVGMESYLNIYRSLGLGKDFKAAFETATGLPLADFYAKFEIIRDKVGMPRGQ
jgi:hypothetical protein